MLWEVAKSRPTRLARWTFTIRRRTPGQPPNHSSIPGASSPPTRTALSTYGCGAATLSPNKKASHWKSSLAGLLLLRHLLRLEGPPPHRGLVLRQRLVRSPP